MEKDLEILPTIEVELYELRVPGHIIGKEVIDGLARRVGVVRSVKLKLPDLKVELIVKGLDIEFPVDSEDISAVGNVIQLKTVIKEAEPIDIHQVAKLRKEILSEIKAQTGSE
ncbi:MAG: hypothetical protein ACTSXJ_00890 [Candidatus Baldrarchaeia archaeon]